MPKSVMWKELTAADLRDKAQAGAIVLLPVASMEQHGPHLPVGVDTILCEGRVQGGGRGDCRRDAGGGGADAVVRHGRASHGLRRHLHVRHPDLSRRARCLLQSLERHGFKRVLIVNGHGGNIAALGAFLPDLARELPGLALRDHALFRAGAAAIAQDARGPGAACSTPARWRPR